jgi:hypothetical protein
MENYDPSSPGAPFIFAFMGIMMIPILVINVICIIGMWRIFEKAGKPGWASLIPIYSAIVFLEIIGKPMWWLIMFVIPCTLPIFGIWALNLLSKSFGQSEGFTIGMIILPYVFFPILGFGKYEYLGPAGAGFVGFKPYDPSVDYKDPFNPNTPPQA